MKISIIFLLIILLINNIPAENDSIPLTLSDAQNNLEIWITPIERKLKDIFCQKALDFWNKNKNMIDNAEVVKFLVVIYPKVDVTFNHNGKRVRLKDDLNPEQLKDLIIRAKKAAEFTKRLYYYFSARQLLMNFDIIVSNSLIRTIKTEYFSSDLHSGPRLSFKPELETAIPHPGKIYFDNINKYDGFINIYSFPHYNATASFGGLQYPMFVPYKLNSEVGRFSVHLAARLYQTLVGFWVHEIFHNIEVIYGLRYHVFRKNYRNIWPDWYSPVHEEEYLYYKGAFENVIIPQGLQKMILRKSHRNTISIEEFNKANTIR